MKHSSEEIINALKIIKETCDEKERRCGSCPFYSTTAKTCHFALNYHRETGGLMNRAQFGGRLMVDYTEVITALREEAEAVQAIEWEIPICTGNHIREAADAIEKLQKERDAAVNSLRDECGCKLCKFAERGISAWPCANCFHHENFEWRGVEQ